MMGDTQTFEQDPGKKPPETDLTEELGNLGRNLGGILRAAWDRPERQKLQQEIEGGLTELGSALKKEARAVSESPMSQRIKTEVGDLGSRVRSGQAEARVREELIGALHVLNTELEKVSSILAAAPATESSDVEESPVADAPAQASQESTAEEVAAGDEAKMKPKTKGRAKAKPKPASADGATDHPESEAPAAEDTSEAG
jgi:hypothetical protein